jgi:transcription elongation factor Elf1
MTVDAKKRMPEKKRSPRNRIRTVTRRQQRDLKATAVCLLRGHAWSTHLHLHGRTIKVRCDRCGHRSGATLDRIRDAR